MAKLYFRYSAMSAGKSLDLLKVACNYLDRNMKVILFNSALDKRFGENQVVSRTGLKKESISYDENTNFYKMVTAPVDCILVDESQFLIKKQVYQLTEIVDILDIPVIAYGLRSDFKNELFEGSTWLFAWADSIEELKTVCWCGKKAICNARVLDGRIVKEGNQIQIGNEQYISLCRKHYKNNKLLI